MKCKFLTVTMVVFCLAALLCGNAALGLAHPPEVTQQTAQQQATTQSPTELATAEGLVLRELHGVKLGMPRDQVNKALGKPVQTGQQMDEFKLDGGDLLTVRYDPQGAVNVIQFYCTDAKRAPDWAVVTGDAQIEQKPNGSKHARKIVLAENFWVTMFQSQSGELTTITISRQHN